MSKKTVAVIGASGIVGQRFCQLLSSHPLFDEPDLYSWHRSGETRLQDVLRVPEETISPSILGRKMSRLDASALLKEGYDAVFSAIPSSLEDNIELEISRKGMRVFTNSGLNRMRDDVPVIVPEVNSDHFSIVEGKDGYIIANGNCSSIGLALPLKPLMEFGPTHVEVTTMQALSGAGYPGVPSLDAVSNIVPHIPSEEGKIMSEVPKMLGKASGRSIASSSLEIDATCTRIPVREGHTESVAVTFQEEAGPDSIINAFSSFSSVPQELSLPTAPRRPIIVEASEDRPQPELDLWRGSPDRARGMAVTVGRVRVKRNTVRFITLSHNTIRGAAGGSILNAELAAARGLL